MPDADSFSWELDQEFQLPVNRRIHILQRQVPVASVLEVDLAPFRETSALWIHAAAERTIIPAGLLIETKLAADGDKFVIKERNGALLTFEVAGGRSRTLTVWRVEETLDMLQIRIETNDQYIYGQLGGLATLPMLTELNVMAPKDPTAKRLISFYSSGLLPPA